MTYDSAAFKRVRDALRKGRRSESEQFQEDLKEVNGYGSRWLKDNLNTDEW